MAFIERKRVEKRESERADGPRTAGKNLETRLAKEDREEHNRFSESHCDDGLNQNLRSRFWVTTNRLTGLETDQANCDRHSNRCSYNVKITGDFS
jgi:hypothetical protein